MHLLFGALPKWHFGVLTAGLADLQTAVRDDRDGLILHWFDEIPVRSLCKHVKECTGLRAMACFWTTTLQAAGVRSL